MIKRILDWLGIEIKDDAECFNCVYLRAELKLEKERTASLTEHIVQILKPKEIVQNVIDTSKLKPITSVHTPFSARRATLERQSREQVEMIQKTSPLIVHKKENDIVPEVKHMASSIDKLEEELGVK